MTVVTRLSVLLTFFVLTTHAARWEVQFFHDEDRSSMSFNDIEFPSAKRGVAVGVSIKDGDEDPVALITTDGGDTWSVTETPEPGISLFFLDETAGWMVTRSGIWFTDEAGRTWKRIKRQRGLLRVHFVSRERGWAIGADKTILETTDGGKEWRKLDALSQVKTTEDRTVFHAIGFVNDRVGLIAGRSHPRNDRDVPIWMDTEPHQRRERPSLTVLLSTKDAGATWDVSSSSLFGTIERVRYRPDGVGLALLRFDGSFEFASELHKLDAKTGKSSPVLRSKSFAVTDIAVPVKGPAVAAGFQPPGSLPSAPIPGRVRISYSHDLQKWEEMDVDYRAEGRRVSLAVAGPDQMWAATDTGMILRFVQ